MRSSFLRLQGRADVLRTPTRGTVPSTAVQGAARDGALRARHPLGMAVLGVFAALTIGDVHAQSAPPGLIPGASAAPKGTTRPPAAAPKPGAAKPVDPALRAEAERRAGALTLASADGERTCPLVLKATPTGPGFAVTFETGGCAAIAFVAEVVAWVPDASGAIRLISAQGRTVAEFTEGAAGTYEALRDGDGVYFLATPAALQADVVHAEELLGEWDLSRVAGTPLCRWSFTDAPVAGGFAVKVAPGCEAGLAAFSPAAWHLEGSNVLVASGAGASTLRFARQEDGGWGKVPERGRPLLMSRP